MTVLSKMDLILTPAEQSFLEKNMLIRYYIQFQPMVGFNHPPSSFAFLRSPGDKVVSVLHITEPVQPQQFDDLVLFFGMHGRNLIKLRINLLPETLDLLTIIVNTCTKLEELDLQFNNKGHVRVDPLFFFGRIFKLHVTLKQLVIRGSYLDDEQYLFCLYRALVMNNFQSLA